jgi:hypothetical protein
MRSPLTFVTHSTFVCSLKQNIGSWLDFRCALLHFIFLSFQLESKGVNKKEMVKILGQLIPF